MIKTLKGLEMAQKYPEMALEKSETLPNTSTTNQK